MTITIDISPFVKRVRRFRLTGDGILRIEMPAGAKLLTVMDLPNDLPCVWAVVEETNMTDMRILMVVRDEGSEDPAGKYVGSYLDAAGQAHHVFDLGAQV